MGKANRNVDSMEICDYMKYLNRNIWEYLFEDALAHETIFSSLSELEQIIISRLLFVQQVVSERAMRLWINPNCLKNLSEGIKNLVETKILVGSEIKKDNYSQYKINDKFRFTLLNKIYKNKQNNIFIFNNNIKEQFEKEKELYEKNLFPTKETIFQYTQNKWNNLLHFIASPQRQNLNIYEEKWEKKEKKKQMKEAHVPYFHGTKEDEKIYNKKKGSGEEEYIDEVAEKQFEEGNYLYDDDLEDETEEQTEEEVEEDEEEEGEENDETESRNDINDRNNKEKKNTNETNNEYRTNSDQYKMKKGKDRKKKKKKKFHLDSNSNVNYANSGLRQTNPYYYQNNTLNQKNQLNYEVGKETKNLSNHNNIISNNQEIPKEMVSIHNEDIIFTPTDSVIEILKRKNFISNESNKNKVISMSREAFSWFLKDLRSRIISLVLEYLLAIDGGNVTSVAKDIFKKYEKKQELEKSKKKDSHNQGNNSKTAENENVNCNVSHHSNYYINNNLETEKQELENPESKNANKMSYAAQTNKDAKKSELYVKETLLFILSMPQCNISQPIFLKNLTKAQKEFINFGIHIGLFYKTNEQFIFITPYALLLNTNDTNTRHYVFLLNNLSIEGLCDNKFKKNLTEKHFHKYLLLQEKNKTNNKVLEKKVTIEGEEKEDGKEGILEKYSAISHHNTHLKFNTASDTVTGKLKTPGNQLKPDVNTFIDNTIDNNNLEIGLIVQSNFKVYLYTSSLLKINILSHLCELQARLPNMVVGLLTRKSVLNAFTSGITANQIIKFLESYSHPFNKNSKNTIPNNVIAQLKLWESERHRLTFEDAIVFKSWERELLPYLYQQIVIWTNNKNYLLYYTPWPKNNTKEFEHWMKTEKYLCCIYESKNEVIEKIKELREILLKKKKKE